MIIGNKCDMEDKRVISSDRGQEVIYFFVLEIKIKIFLIFFSKKKVAKHHSIPFIETSAKTNVNITRAFHDITLRILEKQPEKKPDSIAGGTNRPTFQAQQPANVTSRCC